MHHYTIPHEQSATGERAVRSSSPWAELVIRQLRLFKVQDCSDVRSWHIVHRWIAHPTYSQVRLQSQPALTATLHGGLSTERTISRFGHFFVGSLRERPLFILTSFHCRRKMERGWSQESNRPGYPNPLRSPHFALIWFAVLYSAYGLVQSTSLPQLRAPAFELDAQAYWKVESLVWFMKFLARSFHRKVGSLAQRVCQSQYACP